MPLLQPVQVRPAGAWLTVEGVADALDRPLRTAQRIVAGWKVDGWPRVEREACRGNARGRYLVAADDFDRWCQGEPRPDEQPEPAWLDDLGARPAA
jgi:hypothetical protein